MNSHQQRTNKWTSIGLKVPAGLFDGHPPETEKCVPPVTPCLTGSCNLLQPDTKDLSPPAGCTLKFTTLKSVGEFPGSEASPFNPKMAAMVKDLLVDETLLHLESSWL